MEKQIFFLSYSHEDAEIVQRVAKRLGGRERCWLYDWEAKIGLPVFQFDRGIADSRIFVLFWSKDAALSPWVEEETNQARMRLMRDRGFRLVVVRLDGTPLPDHLAYRVYIDAAKGLDYICRNLESVAQDLTPEEVFLGKPALKDSFQNREREMDLLEQLALSEDYSGIMVLGLDGMGKTSLVKRAIPRLFSHLTPLWVDLVASPTPLRLLSAFARPLGIAIDPEQTALDPEQMWRRTLLPEIAQSDKMFVVLDNLITQRASPRLESDVMDKLIERICYDLAGRDKYQNPNVIVISSKSPAFTKETLTQYRQLQVGHLDEKSMVRALRYYLSQVSYVDYESEKLALLANELHGYPLALSLASARVAEQGLDAVLADKFGLHKMVLDLAQDLLAGLSFDPEEKNLLTLLATSMRPLSVDWLQTISDRHLSAISKIARKQLLDPTSQGYTLHGIISDFVSESIAKPGEIKAAHGQLADLFRNEWMGAPEKSAASAEYGGLAWFHSLSAGRVEEASNLRIAYLEEAKQAAVESYRRGEYKTTVTYVETVKKMDGRPDPTCNFYYALALNRMERSNEALLIMQNLVNEFPERSDYHHGLGTILKWLHRNEDALVEFRRAVVTSRRPNSTALASLADLLCDMGNVEEAKGFAEEAFKVDPGKSHVVSIMSRVLEESGDLEGALSIVSTALRKAPTDARLHGRAGMILKRIRRFPEARDHLEQAVSDPTLTFSYTALADVYLRMREYGKAEDALNKFPGDRRSSASYLSTKANILRHKKDFDEAERCLSRALGIEPDNPVHYGGMAQLYLDQAGEAASKERRQPVLIYIEKARASVEKGLSKSGDIEPLLSIKHAINQFESSIGLR